MFSSQWKSLVIKNVFQITTMIPKKWNAVSVKINARVINGEERFRFNILFCLKV